MGGPFDRNDQNLPDRVRALERKLDAVLKGAPLRNASITEGGLRVGGEGWIKSTEWDGTGLDDPGTEGWALGGPDAAAIFNSLVLRDGIVGNDALAAPVGWCWAQQSQFNFSVATTGEVRAQIDMPVAAGFTQVAAIVVASAGVTNTRASADFLYLEAMLGSVASSELAAPAPAGGLATLTTARVGNISGLSGAAGQTVSVAARVHAQGGAWAAQVANRCYVAALGVCFR